MVRGPMMVERRADWTSARVRVAVARDSGVMPDHLEKGCSGKNARKREEREERGGKKDDRDQGRREG
jgi:hypothetical protein